MERKRTASSGKSSREHALTVLDFHRALEQMADRATSGPGQAAVLSLRPYSDHEWVERALRWRH